MEEIDVVSDDAGAGPSEPPAPPSRSCPVCCDAYTQSVRKPISCAKCEYAACLACCKQYLTTVENAVCMSCNHPWDHEFISTRFPASWFRTEYRAHREKVLVDYEVAQLPTSQHLVGNYRISERLGSEISDLRREKRDAKRRLRQIDVEMWNKSARRERIRASRFVLDGLGERTEEEEEASATRTFVRACPVEECRGFLSAALKCGTCDTWACGKCFGVVGAARDTEHTCNPNDVETAQLIKKDSRPCPTCAVFIFKVSGCDQMWCPQCKKPFSWRTGLALHNVVIHNPVYFEYMRQQNGGVIPRQAGDIPGGADGPCHAYIDPRDIDRACRAQSVTENVRRYLYDVMNKARHIQYHEIRQLADVTRPADNMDLRLNFLLGNIDRDEWKRKLVLREKKREKEISLRNVYELFVTVANEILRNLVAHSTPIGEVVTQLKFLGIETNSYLEGIQKRFDKCQVYFITYLYQIPETK